MATSHRRQLAQLVILLVTGIAIGWALRTIPRGDSLSGGPVADPSSHARSPGSEEPQPTDLGPSAGSIEDQLAAAMRQGLREERRLAVRSVYADLETEDLIRLRAHVDDVSEEMDDGWFLADELYRRWGELAPREALEYLKNHESYWAGMDASAWSSWARTDPDAAMAAYDPSMEGQYSSELQDAILEGLSATDPAKALRFADAQEIGHDGIFTPVNRAEIHESNPATWELLDDVPVARPDDPFGLALYSWIHRDPEAALDAMLPLQHHQLQRASLNALFANWMMRDPDAALEALERIEDRYERESLTHRAMQAYLLHHPREALQRIVLLPDYLEPRDPFAEDNPPSPSALADQVYSALPDRYYDTTPTRSYGQMGLISEAAASLGIVEGRAAWDAAMAIDADDKRAAALGGALAGWLALDLEGAVEFAATGIAEGSFLGPGGQRFPDFAARLVGKVLAQHDFQQATAWVESLPAGPLRDGAIDTTARALLNEAWDRALDEASPDGWVKSTVFQEAQAREYAPIAEWVASLPRSKGRDEAATWLVFRLEDLDDPRLALQWAATIEDSRMRRIHFEHLARKLLPKRADKQKNPKFDFHAWASAHPTLARELRQELKQAPAKGDDDE